MSGTRITDVINDLIRIHEDRIAGYSRARDLLKDAEDADLAAELDKIMAESHTQITQLSQDLLALKELPTNGTTAMGKIYTAWMDIKAFFTGHERQSILNSCEAIEDATKKAYQSALKEAGIPPDLYAQIEHQYQILLASHDRVKKLRDA